MAARFFIGCGDISQRALCVAPFMFPLRFDVLTPVFSAPDAKDDRNVDDDAMYRGLSMTFRGAGLIPGACGERELHRVLQTNNCTLHAVHVDVEDEPLLRKAGITDALHDPHVQARELEERLNVMHEFDSVTQLLTTLKPPKYEFVNPVDVIKMDQYVSMLCGIPGMSARSRQCLNSLVRNLLSDTLNNLSNLVYLYILCINSDHGCTSTMRAPNSVT